MLILAATVCILSDPLTVECRTMALRIEHDRAECVRMLKPTEDWLKEAAGDLPVIYLKAVCKLGVVG